MFHWHEVQIDTHSTDLKTEHSTQHEMHRWRDIQLHIATQISKHTLKPQLRGWVSVLLTVLIIMLRALHKCFLKTKLNWFSEQGLIWNIKLMDEWADCRRKVWLSWVGLWPGPWPYTAGRWHTALAVCSWDLAQPHLVVKVARHSTVTMSNVQK